MKREREEERETEGRGISDITNVNSNSTFLKKVFNGSSFLQGV